MAAYCTDHALVSFNPCFNGTYSLTMTNQLVGRSQYLVLILVLMELTL